MKHLILFIHMLSLAALLNAIRVQDLDMAFAGYLVMTGLTGFVLIAGELGQRK